jgi:hypothetical protein
MAVKPGADTAGAVCGESGIPQRIVIMNLLVERYEEQAARHLWRSIMLRYCAVGFLEGLGFCMWRGLCELPERPSGAATWLLEVRTEGEEADGSRRRRCPPAATVR